MSEALTEPFLTKFIQIVEQSGEDPYQYIEFVDDIAYWRGKVPESSE